MGAINPRPINPYRVIYSPHRAVRSTVYLLATDFWIESADGEFFPRPEADPPKTVGRPRCFQ